MKSEIYLSSDEISDLIKSLSMGIKKHYNHEPIMVIGIMNAAFMFVSDLCRKLLPKYLGFIRLSSYHGKTQSKDVVIVDGIDKELIGKMPKCQVLLVDAILDKGDTLVCALDLMESYNPLSVKSCVLLSKTWDGRKVNADFIGLPVPEKFYIGYGLDYRNKYRHLPEIHTLEI